MRSSAIVHGVLVLLAFSAYANHAGDNPCLSHTGSGEGDPHFVGFHGQQFEFMGTPNHVYNLISDYDVQVNALFIPNNGRNGKEQTFMGAVGAVTHLGDKMSVRCIEDGKLQVNVNGHILKRGEKHVISEDGSEIIVGKSGRQSLVEFILPEFDIKVTRRHNRNTDCYLNVDVDYLAFDSDHAPHGVLGQTALETEDTHTNKPLVKGNDATKFWDGLFHVEGTEADYRVADDDLFGTDFTYNQFGTEEARNFMNEGRKSDKLGALSSRTSGRRLLQFEGVVCGCTDQWATNYDTNATHDDTTCTFDVNPCTNVAGSHASGSIDLTWDPSDTPGFGTTNIYAYLDGVLVGNATSEDGAETMGLPLGFIYDFVLKPVNPNGVEGPETTFQYNSVHGITNEQWTIDSSGDVSLLWTPSISPWYAETDVEIVVDATGAVAASFVASEADALGRAVPELSLTETYTITFRPVNVSTGTYGPTTTMAFSAVSPVTNMAYTNNEAGGVSFTWTPSISAGFSDTRVIVYDTAGVVMHTSIESGSLLTVPTLTQFAEYDVQFTPYNSVADVYGPTAHLTVEEILAVSGTSYTVDMTTLGNNAGADGRGYPNGTLSWVPSTTPGYGSTMVQIFDGSDNIVVAQPTSDSVMHVDALLSFEQYRVVYTAFDASTSSIGPAVTVYITVPGELFCPSGEALQGFDSATFGMECTGLTASIDMDCVVVAGAADGSQSEAVCPEGYTVTGGGFEDIDQDGAGSHLDHFSSKPNANNSGWIVSFNDEVNTFTAYAVCCRSAYSISTLSSLGCGSGSVVTDLSSSGSTVCGNPFSSHEPMDCITSVDSNGRGSGHASGPRTASATCSAGYQLVGGGFDNVNQNGTGSLDDDFTSWPTEDAVSWQTVFNDQVSNDTFSSIAQCCKAPIIAPSSVVCPTGELPVGVAVDSDGNFAALCSSASADGSGTMACLVQQAQKFFTNEVVQGCPFGVRTGGGFDDIDQASNGGNGTVNDNFSCYPSGVSDYTLTYNNESGIYSLRTLCCGASAAVGVSI